VDLCRAVGGEGSPTPHPRACEVCQQADPPRAINRVTVALSVGAVANQAAAYRRLLSRHGELIAGQADPKAAQRRLEAIMHAHGPGSQLWRLLSSLGIEHKTTCDCLNLAEQMNVWGPAGCQEHRPAIVAKMRVNARQYGWASVATAAAKAASSSLVWRLDLLDVYGSLVDEAIRLAEQAPENNPIDILLPLGPGSRYGNVEVRMALRSIAQHAVGVRRVVVLGSIPAFLRSTKGFEFVPLREFKCNKASRISQKVLWAFQHLDLTPTIAFWNDDYLLLRNQDVRTIPNHCHGQLWRKPKNHWNRLLNHTGEVLRAAGFSTRHFDIHIPILYDREKWLAIFDWWERSRRDAMGLVAKSVYGNIHCQGTEARANDAKLQANWQTRLDDLQGRRWVVSYGDRALAAGLAEWMLARFPEPSAAEIQLNPKPQVSRATLRRRRNRHKCKPC
jgi:hypothetical protein